MAQVTPPRPLRAEDDRIRFDCGRESLNQWFRKHAWANQASNVTRTSVLCDADSGEIIAYVSLSAAQIEQAHLAKSAQRDRPDPIPAILLGQLAVDRRYQGQGLSRSLIFYALNTAVKLAETLGCFCVVTHPLDDDVRSFYAKSAFEELPHDPRRAMAVRIADLVKSGFGQTGDR